MSVLGCFLYVTLAPLKRDALLYLCERTFWNETHMFCNQVIHNSRQRLLYKKCLVHFLWQRFLIGLYEFNLLPHQCQFTVLVKQNKLQFPSINEFGNLTQFKLSEA